MNKERIRVISVYGEQKGKNLEEKLKGFMKEEKEGNLIIGAENFNIRIGELGGMEMEGEGVERCSKNKIIRNRGRSFVEWVKDKGLYSLNGRTSGDWEGEYTYIKARDFKVDVRVDSDHLLLCLKIKEHGEEEDPITDAERK
ncbi:hypothetical protein ALC60_14509 [Trachymyrmex zeteki]|uniref:Craniofacial development protein 2 n=1 Tax=Mycetomoellerius zeteki TaxID=64791 RepID=A0A151WF01_9HYME|nr:hypothetical protein ALC60_14509 [Trachymyrmex zeteki]